MVELAIDGFVARRSAAWAELDALCARVEAGGTLEPAAVLRLGGLYREAVADLAFARRRFPGAPLVFRLEELVGTGRETVYDSPPRPGLRPVLHFVTRGWWRLARLSSGWTLLALALLGAALALTAVWADADPLAAARTLPVPLRRLPLAPHLQLASAVGLPRGVPGLAASWTPLAALVAAALALAGGLLGGLGSLAVIVILGLQLGVPIGLAVSVGQGGRIVDLLAADGGLLLVVVALAAGQGLRLGWTQLRAPGMLGERGNDAAMLFAGSAPLLAVAAGLQALISPGAGAAPVAPLGLLVLAALPVTVAVRGGQAARPRPAAAAATAAATSRPG